jgi:hypothetical protein
MYDPVLNIQQSGFVSAGGDSWPKTSFVDGNYIVTTTNQKQLGPILTLNLSEQLYKRTLYGIVYQPDAVTVPFLIKARLDFRSGQHIITSLPVQYAQSVLQPVGQNHYYSALCGSTGSANDTLCMTLSSTGTAIVLQLSPFYFDCAANFVDLVIEEATVTATAGRIYFAVKSRNTP